MSSMEDNMLLIWHLKVMSRHDLWSRCCPQAMPMSRILPPGQLTSVHHWLQGL